MIFRGVFGLFYQKYPKGGPLENFEKNKKKFWTKKKQSPLKSFIILTWGHTKNFVPKKWVLGVFLDYFIKNIQRGDPWKILKKTKKKNFWIPPKILHNTHMRSHKKIRAKKTIFRGAFGLFSQKYPKGGPLENLEKKKLIFFPLHLKSFIILIWGHTKNFGLKKWFLGVLLEGGSQRERKYNLAFGASYHM